MKYGMKSVWFALMIVTALPALEGTTIYISPEGKSGATGTRDRPLRSVQAGLTLAGAGDTVFLLPGVYHERVRFVRGGEYGRPVTLTGSRDAVLDAAYPDPLKWVPAFEVAENVYFARTPGDVATLTVDGKVINMIHYKRVDPEVIARRLSNYAAMREKNAKLPEKLVEMHNPVENFSAPVIFQRGVGKRGWNVVKAVGMYHPRRGGVLLKFGDGSDPRKMAVFASPRGAAVTVAGLNRAVISGLTIRHAWIGVEIERSLGSVVENCRIKSGNHGVKLIAGSSHGTIRGNEISMDLLSGNSPAIPGSWDIWVLHKMCGFWDSEGIWIQDSIGFHRIHDNFIHHHWGGIQDIGTGNANMEIHHNLLQSILDDGLEPNGDEVNCAWHDNIVIDCLCACRLKCIGRGPAYFYRNIFLHNHQDDFRNYKASPNRAEVYVYHNTCDGEHAYKNHRVPVGTGVPRYAFFNNLFYCRTYFKKTSDTADPDWQADYNLLVRRGNLAEWEAGKRLASERKLELHSRWIDAGFTGFRDYEHGDLALTAASPARNAGGEPEKICVRPLPGVTGKYYPGRAPDCGALQFGEPMPRLPRRGFKVDAPGLWPPRQ